MSDPLDFSPNGPHGQPQPTEANGKTADERPWSKSSKEAEPANKAHDTKSGVKTAQGLMLFIGVLGFGLNLYLLANLDNEIAQAKAAGAWVPKDKIEQFRVAYFMATSLSLLFVFLGFVVWRAPLAITIVVFLLYLVGNLVFMMLTGPPGGGAMCAKVFFAIAFGRAISYAAAYESEKKAEKRKREAEELEEAEAGEGDEREQRTEMN